ncbi:MAG: T9SS type A sorting domain-containing protein [Chitinophagales bacterium]|nr:T9SS type A sorting domain-containing protein [Chitinophagales bacterium]
MIVFLLAAKYAFAAVLSPNDSVNTGPGNSQMVFYRLSDGTKTTSSNTDWHLAITVRSTEFPNSPLGGTTIRINEANGVAAYVFPNSDSSQFAQLSVNSYSFWNKLHDSDSLMDLGAFNAIRTSNVFDFGWGFYNSASHHVVGTNFFLVKLPNGKLKKFYVEKLLYDTAFIIRYANIDNTNEQVLNIRKKDYLGKNFVYLNLENNALMDKEPLRTDWDLQFIKYTASKGSSREYEPEVGVWLNKGWSAARRADTDVNSFDFTGIAVSPSMSAVGWNWKTKYFNDGSRDAQANFSYKVIDSLAYLLTKGNKNYKLVFTDFSTTTGNIGFNLQELWATDIIESAPVLSSKVYPNPTENFVTIEIPVQDAEVTITDLAGRTVVYQRLTDTINTLNVSALSKGVYLVGVSSGNQKSTHKLVLAR